MRKSPHFRGLFSGESAPGPPIVTIAVDDGPLPVEFNKTTIILGATLLANDIIPNGATVISVQAFVGGTGVVFGGNVHWSQGFLPPLASSFSYTIQDNVTTQTSTATVTLTSFFPVVACVDDGPSFDITTEFRPLILSKFGGGTITANDTFGGASPANPVNVTVLIPSTPAYNTLFDTNVPGIYTLVIPPSINQIEIETWGAQGGRGGDLSAPGAANGLPQQVAGLGAHRLVTNLAVTPGQILSIAVGGAGGIGDTTAGQGLPNNIGTGGLGGQGFADNSTSPTGGILGTGQHDSFGFPDGDGFSAEGGRGVCTNCDGLGGASGSDGTPPNQPTLIVAPGGGGGAGSGVTVGDATTSNGTPLNRLGPVLNVAGGGGGGSGASVTDTSRGPGQDGGPPDPNRIPSTSFFGSNGQTAMGPGSTGGGGGGYRGGHSFPQVDINTGRRIGFGGESNDERYKVAGERTVGNKTPSIQSGPQEIWPAFSGSTTTEFPSLQVGNGRVRIRGRTVVDQLGGTQFPIHCKVVDLGATIQITPDIPFNIAGSATNECSFFYFLTDTKTGETSGVCQVRMDIVANVINAVNDGPFGVIESVNSNIAIATIQANDTFTGTPTFDVSLGNFLNSLNIVGPNVRVNPVDRIISTTAFFQYDLGDPLMPVGFELLSNRKTDTAIVNLNINLPTPIVGNDTGPSVIEDLGQSPPSVVVSKATLLLNDNCGSQPCTFSNISVVALNNCVIVSTAGGNVTVRAAGPVANGNCTWRYRVTNAQGAFSAFATVTHTVLSVPFVVDIDTGFHSGPAASLQGNRVVPGGKSLMKTEVWGAAGGDGGDGGFAGRGAIRRCVSNVSPGDVIDFSCGTRGTPGNPGGIFGGTNGLGGSVVFSASSGGNPMNGFPSIGSCPLVSDGGTPVGGLNIPVGGGATSGDNFGCPGPFCEGGGGGGGAGSVVWFSGLVTNNIISCAGGGGGAGATATGSSGGLFGASCTAHGRTMTTPFPIAARRAHGGGGGGFPGGDESSLLIGPDNGGPGGGSSGNTGRFISGTQVVTTEPTRTFGRVIISFA